MYYMYIIIFLLYILLDFLVAQGQRTCLPMQKTQVQSIGHKDPLEKEMETHSSILAWEIPWMEEPRGGSQKIQTQLSDNNIYYIYIYYYICHTHIYTHTITSALYVICNA